MGVAVCMVIVKSYFTRGSRIYVTCWRLSKIELSVTKVNGFQCKAIATIRCLRFTSDYNIWESN